MLLIHLTGPRMDLYLNVFFFVEGFAESWLVLLDVVSTWGLTGLLLCLDAVRLSPGARRWVVGLWTARLMYLVADQSFSSRFEPYFELEFCDPLFWFCRSAGAMIIAGNLNLLSLSGFYCLQAFIYPQETLILQLPLQLLSHGAPEEATDEEGVVAIEVEDYAGSTVDMSLREFNSDLPATTQGDAGLVVAPKESPQVRSPP
jgi:hypothetical protein